LDSHRLVTHNSHSSVLPRPISIMVRELATILPVSRIPKKPTTEEICNQLNILAQLGLLEQEHRYLTGEYASFSITTDGIMFVKQHIDKISSAIKDKKINEGDIDHAEGTSEAKNYLK
jgi:hypothetical protein